MKKNQHRINMRLVLASIILCCSCLILINCIGKADFERNIDFDSDWQQTNNTFHSETTSTFKKEFELDIQNDKVYLLQISSSENISELRVNSTIIAGTRGNENEINFNITDQLKEKNIIQLTKQNGADFEAKIHCVNKLFIPGVEVQLNDESVLVEVKVKNAYNTEKQGTLEYVLYSGENEKLEIKETPVFVSGNAENIYRQEFNLNLDEMNIEGLSVVCKLYSEGKLFDKNFDDL